MTYSDDKLPKGGNLVKDHLQLFLKRLRARLEDANSNIKIRYFACGEYGEKFDRPHYHLIIWGLGNKHRDFVEKSWTLGFVRIDEANNNRFAYVAGYVTKKKLARQTFSEKRLVPPFVTMSRNRGLGYHAIARRARELRARS